MSASSQTITGAWPPSSIVPRFMRAAGHGRELLADLAPSR
jgi:hypothetical protein